MQESFETALGDLLLESRSSQVGLKMERMDPLPIHLHRFQWKHNLLLSTFINISYINIKPP